MIELMVVVGIMVVLAGMLIASLPGIQSRVNRNKVEAFMAELESGLSKYQIDHGAFPQNPVSGDRDSDGVEGAGVLYKHLSGDYDLSGTIDLLEAAEDNGGVIKEGQIDKVYVPKLDIASNEESRTPRSTERGGEPQVMDSYGNPFRYLAEPPNIPEKERKTYNPTYELWSITDTDPKNEDEQARHITNWQSN